MFSASKIKGAGGFQIANSLRFRSSASAYLNRTPASASNRTTWTWSGWVKRGSISQTNYRTPFGGGETAITFYDDPTYNSQIIVNLRNAGTNVFLNYAPVFRDTSAWYHFVFACDTTQVTASNRFKLYVNGVQITAAGSLGLNYPTQNWTTGINSTALHTIGAAPGVANLFDGYLAEVNFIDGQALTPSSFGETDAVTGVWKPKRYSGTYGTNGFRLNFSNGTSTTTLGNDSSGNGNNWTTNNISLTAGSTYDWMIDSPTPYPGSSYGVGNYCTLNPLSNLYGSTLSNANLTTSCTTANAGASGTFRLNSGKWYHEYTVQSTGSPLRQWLGYLDNSYRPDDNNWPIGAKTLLYANDGTSAATYAAYGASYTTGDVIGVAFDIDGGTIVFYKNGASQGTFATGISGTDWRPFVSYGSTGWAGSFNFGQRPFAYTPPSGYKSLCTQNLSTPSIVNGAQYMAATTYTGTGSSLSVSNSVSSVSFQPDLVWAKQRNGTNSNTLFDSVRGVFKYLYSNATTAEVSDSSTLTAFNVNGFSVSSAGNVNTNAATYVAWQWKAGGTAVTNTAGSITSQVSANTTAGFSVVTWSGNSTAGATVGHGLGVAPGMVIVKSRTSTTDWWQVFHSALGGTATIWLNSTSSAGGGSAQWNNTAPSSSVITLGGAGGGTNSSGATYVAYCFAAISGYSAFGSYTGNGSADGPFIYTGFRPRYVLIKASSIVDNWDTFDTSRDTYNATTRYLYSNLSNAEDNYTAYPLDILSNGFKIRNASYPNQSSATYIYAAFAENPFQNALAR